MRVKACRQNRKIIKEFICMGEIANRDNKKMLILFAEVVAVLATILIAILAMKIPVVPVCGSRCSTSVFP